MAMGGVDANLGIDSKIGVDAESRCRNSKWTKNSASDLAKLTSQVLAQP